MLYVVAGATDNTAFIHGTFRFALEQNLKDEDLWTRFVERHLGVHNEYYDGQGCLHLAVRHGRPEVVRMLLKKSAPVNAKDNKGKLPLHYAVEKKDMESVLLLINADRADRSLKDKEKHTCLHYAVEAKDEEIVLALLKDQDLMQPYITKEFLEACNKADVDMITVLLKAGVTGTNESKETPLHIVAAKKEGSVELVKMLIKQGVDTKARRRDGGTVLHAAVEGGNLEVISAILDTSPEIAATNELGQTVLHTLVKSNTLQKVDGQELVEEIRERAKICTKLVTSGVPVMAFDAEGKSALSYALEEQDHVITKILVTHYSETQPLDTKGNLLIHELVRHNHRVLDDQIKLGRIKNLEAVTPDDGTEGGVAQTPLVMAALKHKASAFEVLVRHGADITRRHDSRSMLKLLLEIPKDVAIDATLKELLKRDGIRQYLEDGQPDNKTPMQLAFEADRQGCVEQLAAAGATKPDVWTYDFSQKIIECDVEGIKKKLSLFNIDLATCEPSESSCSFKRYLWRSFLW
jgi:ankyrin repeat protein